MEGASNFHKQWSQSSRQHGREWKLCSISYWGWGEYLTLTRLKGFISVHSFRGFNPQSLAPLIPGLWWWRLSWWQECVAETHDTSGWTGIRQRHEETRKETSKDTPYWSLYYTPPSNISKPSKIALATEVVTYLRKNWGYLIFKP